MQALHEADKFAVQGRWDEALNIYNEALEESPGNTEYRIKVEKAKYEAALIHINKGKDLAKKKKYDIAMLEFRYAYALNPSLKRAQLYAVEMKKRKDSEYYYNAGLKFLESGKDPEARASFKKALSLNPGMEEAEAELAKIKSEKKTFMGGYELNLKSKKPITLKFKDTPIKDIFEIISKLSGINFIFDSEIKKKKASIYIEDATFEQAMDLLLMTNKLFQKVINENTIIIVTDSKTKRRQYQDLMIHTFSLSNLDAKKSVNMLRTLLQIKSIYVNEKLNSIIIRDTPEVIALAEKILRANDLADSEVMLEVEILEVQRSDSSDIGINLTKDAITLGLSSLDQDNILTYSALRNATRADMLFSIPNIVINMQKRNGNAKILANPKIRVANNKKAKIHIGDRVPIITSTTNNGVTTENVQYVDIGVKLNVEPRIHLDNEVSLKISLEISSLGKETKTAQSTVYQIGTRNAETELRLHDGETQIIGGLISDSERETVIKVPFLGDIPIIGRLFSSVGKSNEKTDILLSITPHIIRTRERADPEDVSIWSGREQEFSSKSPFESFKSDEPDITLPEPPPQSTGGVPVLPRETPEEVKSEGAEQTSSINTDSGEAAASLFFEGPTSVNAGDEFDVKIKITTNVNIVSVPFYLMYDPNLVEISTLAEGGFLKSDGRSASFLTSNDIKKGRLIVGYARLGDREGISGAGDILTVKFKAVKKGKSRFYLQNYKITDGKGSVIPARVKDLIIELI